MKYDIIKTNNYLLVVDESAIKEGDFLWSFSNTRIVVAVKSTELYIHSKKIIAHLPLNNSPILEGVPLLPPFEIEDSNKDLFYQKQVMNPYLTGGQSYVSYEKGFMDGYNQAKEKYKYTEEDLRKAFLKGVSVTREGYNAEYARDYEPNIECVFGEKADKFIQSLSQPKMPIWFERYYNGEDIAAPKITTTPEGHTQWVGRYIYEVK